VYICINNSPMHAMKEMLMHSDIYRML